VSIALAILAGNDKPIEENSGRDSGMQPEKPVFVVHRGNRSKWVPWFIRAAPDLEIYVLPFLTFNPSY
jgi:hypothetical protein